MDGNTTRFLVMDYESKFMRTLKKIKIILQHVYLN